MTHTDDIAVDRFAAAMKAKLAKKRDEGRGGWDGPTCSAEILSALLRQHVEKGDPLDVGNLAMMLHQRGERIVIDDEARTIMGTTPPAEPVVEADWINYRPLAEGEVIQEGDECLTDSHLGWQPAANTVGGAAPDPLYTSHRLYRRALATKPAVKDDETVVEALRNLTETIKLMKRSIIGGGASKREMGDLESSLHAANVALAAKEGRS